MSRTQLVVVVLALAWTMAAGGADAAMQKGDVITLAAATELKTRPVPDAEALAPAAAGADATLLVRVSNTSGNWWYVEVDGKNGWLPEPALAAADPTGAPAVPVPAAPQPAVEATAPPRAAAEPAKPAARPLTAAGSREIAGAFEYFKDSNDSYDLSVAYLALKYGVCLTDIHEVGIDTSYIRASGAGYTSNTYTIAPFYTHNLPSPPSDVVPYVSVGAGISRSDDDDGFGSRSTFFEASAGVRAFVSDDVALNLAAYFRKTDTEVDDFGSYDLDSRTVGARAGLSFFLR